MEMHLKTYVISQKILSFSSSIKSTAKKVCKTSKKTALPHQYSTMQQDLQLLVPKFHSPRR